MKNSLPHSRLISVAAELVRGPTANLGEREASLPKWAQVAIESGFDRQRELAVVIRGNADQLRLDLAAAQEHIARLEDENTNLKLSLTSGGGRPSSAGPVLNAMKDRIAELKSHTEELEALVKYFKVQLDSTKAELAELRLTSYTPDHSRTPF